MSLTERLSQTYLMINTDIEMTAHDADKYDMKEFMDLLCFKMKAQAEDLKNEFTADVHCTC